MFKVGLKKELDKAKKSSKNGVDLIVKEAQLLLTQGAEEEAKALRVAGLDHQAKVVEKSRGVELERERFENEYGNDVYTREEIKQICLKYDLRFLPSEYYRGKLDTQVASKLKRFIAEHQHEMGNSGTFYIIAPDTLFELEDRPAKPFWTINTDPILVYKLPRQDKYVYIHKWGVDFTLIRRFRGMFFKSLANMWTIGASFWMIALSALFGFLFKGFTGEPIQYLNMIWIAALSFIFTYVTLAIMFNEGERFNSRTTENMWDERYKRRRV
jgi:hypothetical protein